MIWNVELVLIPGCNICGPWLCWGTHFLDHFFWDFNVFTRFLAVLGAVVEARTCVSGRVSLDKNLRLWEIACFSVNCTLSYSRTRFPCDASILKFRSSSRPTNVKFVLICYTSRAYSGLLAICAADWFDARKFPQVWSVRGYPQARRGAGVVRMRQDVRTSLLTQAGSMIISMAVLEPVNPSRVGSFEGTTVTFLNNDLHWSALWNF